MPIHLRQLCLAAEHLDPLVEEMNALLELPVCHRDPEVAHFGLANIMFALGSQFLEVVGPITDNTAAGRFMERRGGPGGYMVICQSTTLEEQSAVRARAGESNVRVAYESHRGSWNIMQLHPRDMGATFLEVDWDEQANPEGNWQPAGGQSWTPAARPDSVSGIIGATLSSDDPQQLAQHWSRILGYPLEQEREQFCIRLPNATLRFKASDEVLGSGLTGIELSVAQPQQVLARASARGLTTGEASFHLCGVEFSLQAQA